MQFETIETERLILRKLTQAVYDYIYQQYDTDELMNFLGLASMNELVVEKTKYQQGLSMFNKDFLTFQLIDKNTNKIIGWCGYHTWFKAHFRAEIGYHLLEDSYKRKGLMSEALKVILDYGFNEMGLNRVEALIGPNNIASLKLIAKMDFTKEGVLRSHYFVNDRLEDSIIYALLKKEYEQSQA